MLYTERDFENNINGQVDLDPTEFVSNAKISARTKSRLLASGYLTRRDVADASDEDLLAISGFGGVRVREVRRWVGGGVLVIQEQEPSGQVLPKGAYTVDEFCKAYGIGRHLAYTEMGGGRLQYRKAGRRTVIRKVDADAWLDSLPAA